MKKLLVLLLAGVMSLSTTACGGNTEEDITDEKIYYQFVDEKWVVAENPTNAQKDVLFERVLFNHVKEAFNENTDYYYMLEIVPDLFKKVENPVKEEYEQYIYYEKEKNIPEKEYMFTLNNTKFVLPKEKSETKEEIIFTLLFIAILLLLSA
mgnify:CR=1 FL=1